MSSHAPVARATPYGRFEAEGVCAVCGLIVPVRVMPKTQRTAAHYPDDPAAHAYEGSSRYYCRGSNETPASLLEPQPASPPVASISVAPDIMQALMDADADQLDGRVAVIAIVWADDLEGHEIRRRAEAYAAKISDSPAVQMTRIRTYGTALNGDATQPKEEA